MRKRAVSAVAAVLMVLTAAGVGSSPAAAEEAEARPSSGDPVIVVGGFLAGQPVADVFYQATADRLRADGYDPYIFGLPEFGLDDVRDMAHELDTFVDDVLSDTGAERVDLVAHSLGGLVSRYYIQDLDGAHQVDHLVTLGTPHQGTALANISTLLGFGVCFGITSCQQMQMGSDFLGDLNAGDRHDVSYTAFVTVYDEVVFPYWNGRLHGDGDITNVTVQSDCWFKYVEHLGLGVDAVIYSGIRQALADETIQLDCRA